VAALTLGSAGGAVSREPIAADAEEIARACAAIRAENPGVELLCEPNVVYRALGAPDDPSQGQMYALSKLQLPEAWDISTGSVGILVAVVDSGVDHSHEDLRGNMFRNVGEVAGNGLDDDGNGFIDDLHGYDFVGLDGDPSDPNGHGTHCAGTIGAKGNNAVGVVGVNWNVSLLAVRVLDVNGYGTLTDVAAGVRYAVDRGARVLNLSLGGPDQSQILENALTYARDRGVLVVAAAGNSTSNNDLLPSYPASSTLENIVAVAATDSSDQLSWFSNYGATSVDVAAPGSSILSTIPGNGYAKYSGTSMAAPQVAGLAALLLSLDPTATAADLKAMILGSATKIKSLEGKVLSGGRINAFAALGGAPGGGSGGTPGGGDSSGGTPAVDTTPVKLTLRVATNRTRARFTGRALSAQGSGVADRTVSLTCGSSELGSAATLADGGYEFKMKLPRRSTKCSAVLDTGLASRAVRVTVGR
jgi:subtilisin family serine protease